MNVPDEVHAINKKVDELKAQMATWQARTEKRDSFIDMLIEREARKASLQKAVIEKSLTALVISGLTTGALLMLEGAKQWWKQR